jgi:murein DD-endopeptidase MepM/ murein hydrolase activator NlpD
VTRRLVLLAALLTVLVGATVAPAFGDSLESDLERVQENVAFVRGQISTVAAERSELARDILATADALDAADRQVAAAADELGVVRTALDLRTDALEAVRRDLSRQLAVLDDVRSSQDSARSEAEDWAVRAYMSGGPAQPTIAFNARAVADISVGVAYLEVLTAASSSAADRYAALADEEAVLVGEIEQAEKQIESEIEDLDALLLRRGAAEQALLDRRTELEAVLAEQEVLLGRLEDEIEHFEGELAALAREESSIRAEIAAAAVPEKTTTVSSSGFVRPVPGAVSSGFGMRIHPITGQNRMHNGVDMNASQGDPIRAARDGTIILAGVKGGYGNTIMIDHGGGMVTLYAHQSRLGVSLGDRVSAGQVIGYIGSTGQSTAPHLHFEVRIDGNPVDPARYL